MKRRNENGCIFNEHGVQFCPWSSEMMEHCNSEDEFDRLEICKLCQLQDILKTISYGTKLMGNMQK